MKRILIISSVVVFIVISKLAQAQDAISFSAQGGFYDNSFELSLSCENPENQIYYTTNGATPTDSSFLYTGPLMLDETMYSHSEFYNIRTCPGDYELLDSIQRIITIRAAAFDTLGNCVSDIHTNSYIIKSLGCEHTLPVVSICIDSLSLFDYYTGIFVPGVYWDENDPDWTGNYYQSGDEWEREMNIEFYETDNTGFNQNAGLRTHGGNSRRERQKGMKIYARKEYGKKNFKYKMFEDKDITSFKRFVFKPFVCSWTDSGIQDYVCCHLASNLNIDCIATRPVVMYINGEYYGVYFIQERIDKNYLEENFDVDGDDCNMMDNWFGDINEGDNTQFLSLIDWVYEADLSDTSSYNYMCDKINIDNFIDYQIFEIFIANLDWPANNMRCWQKDDNGEWRWIFYDGDAGMIDLNFDAFTNALYNDSTPGTWPSSNTQSTLFLRKLIENDTFKVNFINRFNNLLSTTFQYDSISPYIAECSGLIENEIQGQLYRFNKPASYDSWLDAIDDTYNFIQSRTKDVSELIIQLWGGISDKQLFRFKCYPNPSSNSFNILYDNISDEKSTTLAIYDISGQCVFTKTVSCNFGLNILSVDTELPDGIYFIQFGNSYVKHIIQ